MRRLMLLLLLAGSAHAASWECINRTAMFCNTWRMQVPAGWIVGSDNSATGGEHGYAMVFVPDVEHKWGG